MQKYLLFLILNSLVLNGITQEIQIDSDFPGGNIIVKSIKNDTIRLTPDNRDSKEPWFYWYFRIRGAANKKIIFIFEQVNCITSKGPSVSNDNGKSWKWLFLDSTDTQTFNYNFTSTDTNLRFCVSIPYTQQNLINFLLPYKNNKNIKLDTLCITPKGRVTERITIKKPLLNPTYSIVITARQHACEMMASWVLEGIMKEALQNIEKSDWLANNCEFIIIPLFDKDGVEDGDQGKSRTPHDHNGDWIQGIYCQNKTIMANFANWTKNKKVVAIDLHCPWIKYDWNERIFMVGTNDSLFYKKQVIFAQFLDSLQQGELHFNKTNIYPYGTGWNITNEKTKNEKLSFSRWVKYQPNTLFSTTIEFSYANNSGQTINIENSRNFGIDLTHSLQEYLKNIKQTK